VAPASAGKDPLSNLMILRWWAVLRRKGALALLVLLAADLVSKTAAYALLEPGEEVRPEAMVQLVLRLNFTGQGVWAAEMFANSAGDELARSGFGCFAVGVLLIATRDRQLSPTRRVLLCAGAFLVAIVLGAVFQSLVGHQSRAAGALIARIGGTAFYSSLWWISERGFAKAATTLLAAAGLGNGLCLLVPPHAIVDFLYSALLTRALNHGVVNLADLYFDLGAVGLIAVVGRALTRWVAAGLRRQLDWWRG
jgi:hypothetical protein